MHNLCTVWPLSESVSNMYLCFQTRASAVSQQPEIQSVSVSVNSDQVTEQSNRCKLSVEKKSNSHVFIYFTGTRILRLDSSDMLIALLLKGHMKQHTSQSKSMISAAVTHAFQVCPCRISVKY